MKPSKRIEEITEELIRKNVEKYKTSMIHNYREYKEQAIIQYLDEQAEEERETQEEYEERMMVQNMKPNEIYVNEKQTKEKR